LLGAKIGVQKWFRNRWKVKLMVGADNLLDQDYSLGNDLNGFGGRYYNAAAGRNYYASVVLEWRRKDR
jgi:iron complex outermembrane receptor protein